MTDYVDYIDLPSRYVPGCILCDSDVDHFGHIFPEDLEAIDSGPEIWECVPGLWERFKRVVRSLLV